MERSGLGKALQARLTESIAEQLEERTDQILAELRATRQELRELKDAVRGLEIRHRRDMYFAGELRAVRESERFVAEHMVHAKPFPNPEATLRFACDLVSDDGLVLQFGVGEGESLRLLAQSLRGHEVYGFDSFTGLPEDWRPGLPAGFGAQRAPTVRGATVVEGSFEETLPGFLAEHGEPIALLHLNADVYSSTTAVLDRVGDRLVPGSVVVLDEYFNYPGWQDGEFKAWAEFVQRSGVEFRYEGYTFDNEQVVLSVTAGPR
jgi:hypothetical protein